MIIKRTLKGTDRQVTLELNEIEAAHLLYLERKCLGLNTPIDSNVIKKMADLADHFERKDNERQ